MKHILASLAGMVCIALFGGFVTAPSPQPPCDPCANIEVTANPSTECDSQHQKCNASDCCAQVFIHPKAGTCDASFIIDDIGFSTVTANYEVCSMIYWDSVSGHLSVNATNSDWLPVTGSMGYFQSPCSNANFEAANGSIPSAIYNSRHQVSFNVCAPANTVFNVTVKGKTVPGNVPFTCNYSITIPQC